MENLEEAFRDHLKERLQDREAFRDHLKERLQDHKVALKHTQLILQVETYSRILQGYNDQIFQQLNYDERDILRKMGVYYSVLFFTYDLPLAATHWPATSFPVTKLLDPPTNLHEIGLQWVEYALGKLSNEQLHAAAALLPVLNQLKSGPFRRNALQHPVPTINEGIRHIEKSPLGPNDKSTLIASLTNGLQTLQGEALFWPSNSGETEVDFEREIQDLEMHIAELR